MELQTILSDFITATIFVLLAGTVLYPLALSAVRDADRWLARQDIRSRDDLWRKLAAWMPGDRGLTSDTGDPPGGQAATAVPATKASERRQHGRLKTRFLGSLHPDSAAPAVNLCDVIDLSAGGARIRPVDPLPDAPMLALGLNRFGLLPAQVVWRDRDEVGLRFLQSPAEVSRVMRGLVPASGPVLAPAARAA